MGPLTVLFSLFLALLCFGMSAGASQEAYTARKQDTITHFAIAGTIFSFLAGIVTFLVTGGDFIPAAYNFTVVATAIAIPLAIASNSWANRAKLYYDHACTLSAWAIENYSSIVREGGDYITASDIERALRNTGTSDYDRRMLCWLKARLWEIGHEVELYRSYSVSINDVLQETPVTTQVFGVTKEDFRSYPARVLQRPEMSWLIAPPSASVTTTSGTTES